MENLDNALQMTPSHEDDDDVDMSNLVEVQKALERKRAEIEMSEKAKLITDPVEEPNVLPAIETTTLIEESSSDVSLPLLCLLVQSLQHFAPWVKQITFCKS